MTQRIYHVVNVLLGRLEVLVFFVASVSHPHFSSCREFQEVLSLLKAILPYFPYFHISNNHLAAPQKLMYSVFLCVWVFLLLHCTCLSGRIPPCVTQIHQVDQHIHHSFPFLQIQRSWNEERRQCDGYFRNVNGIIVPHASDAVDNELLPIAKPHQLTQCWIAKILKLFMVKISIFTEENL